MTLKAGIIGFGYWGPNIARNIDFVAGATVSAICDPSAEARARAAERYPHASLHKDYREVTGSSDVDLVCVVTPVATHYEMARHALENGKHVFIEKPITASVAEAEGLIELAEKKRLTLMVDHTFLFTGAVRKIKEIIDSGELGQILYYDSTRINLGLFQHDINVVWDLAPHDLSVMKHVTGIKPASIAAHGLDHFGRSIENVAYITIYGDSGNKFIAHFNLNWMSPVKVRSTLIGGDRKMLIWDDLAADEKIKVYDKGINLTSQDGLHQLLVGYRSGDAHIPRVNHVEALRVEMEYLVECLNSGARPMNDGISGLEVVKLLEAADRSMKMGGQLINL